MIPPDVFGMQAAIFNEEENASSKARTRIKLLAPQIMLREYKKRHSHESLVRELENRTFVVGFYSCPVQAGNRLADFTAALTTAMVTNSTLLWKSYDADICASISRRSRSKSNNVKWCYLLGSEEDCAKVLTRAKWIPSYDEWAPKLGLPAGETLIRPYSRDRLIVPKPGSTLYSMSSMEKMRFWDQTNSFNHQRALQLFSEGEIFLHGMLFHETLPIRQEMYSPENNSSSTASINNSAISVALHSRHIHSSNTGKNISRESECLDEIFSALGHQRNDGTAANTTCKVFLMSDRENTVTRLSQFVVEAWNCTAIVVAGKERGSGLTSEHGAFAGVGYFQDLAMARVARNGFVGNCDRSSSQLLQSLIAYDRHLDSSVEGRNWTTGRLDPLPRCCLPIQYVMHSIIVG
jgi:hypothetical protein